VHSGLSKGEGVKVRAWSNSNGPLDAFSGWSESNGEEDDKKGKLAGELQS
jgi:hypothetical protein